MNDSSSPSEEEACAFAMQLVTASVLPAALKTAIELDLLELIKKAGSVSPAELAAQIPTTNPEAPVMLDRILRLLAANNILDCKLRTLPAADAGVERLYSLSPLSKFLTRNNHGYSLAPLLLISQDKILMQIWQHLKEAVVEGGVPFDRAYGMNAFQYPATDPRLNKIFNQGMSQQSAIFMDRIVEIYKGFEGLKCVVDVGGGIGASLQRILSKYPSIKGINFDLPHVIQDAPSFPGVEHIAGDMFVSVPRGDAIFMKWVCHDWEDEECLKLLKNCHDALPDYGRVIIADRLLPEIPEKTLLASTDYAVDVMMLAYGPSGKERTESQFRALAKASGFNQFRKLCSCFNIWIMELYK
ncbi:hypothetical protein ACS0TY_010535 [Phlomoides rotata]